MNWYLKVLRQYADFNGRARRKEFWMFYLFNALIMLAIALLGILVMSSLEVNSVYSKTYWVLNQIFVGSFILYYLVMFIPTLAAIVRRLHDTNNSGWMYFVSFIPLIGPIWLLVLLATEGTDGENEYGEDPKKVTDNNSY